MGKMIEGGKEERAYFFCSSSEWNQVSKAEKEKLGLNYDDDGESWSKEQSSFN